MKALFTLSGILLSSILFSQAQIVMDGTIGIKMNGGTSGNPIYLVMDNPSDNAIVDVPPLGGAAISSESEYNIVKWNVGTSTGVYRMPFISPTPLTYVAPEVTITTPGAGAGSIEFSTYRHDNTLANTPSDVTHMNYDATGLAGGSASAIDRFWVIDALGYTTKPAVGVQFFYDVTELEIGMDPNQLLVQRFNPSTSSWIDYYINSTSVPGLATAVTPIISSDFFRSWTLSDINDPLPVELLDFQVACNGTEGVKVEWATASEINNSHFVVERSEEGIFWEIISPEVHGAVNSNVQNNYSFIDNNPARGINYYRLTQVDFDGTTETFAASASDCDGDGFELVNVFGGENDNMMQIIVSASRNETFDMELLDMSGKRVSYQPNVSFNEGLHTYQINKGDLGYGIYYLRLINQTEVMTRKILLN